MKHNSQMSTLEPTTYHLLTDSHSSVPDLIPCPALNFTLTVSLPFSQNFILSVCIHKMLFYFIGFELYKNGVLCVLFPIFIYYI